MPCAQLLGRARVTLRSGFGAVVPQWLIVRLATSGGGEPVAARVAEIVAAGGGAAVLAKVGTASWWRAPWPAGRLPGRSALLPGS